MITGKELRHLLTHIPTKSGSQLREVEADQLMSELGMTNDKAVPLDKLLTILTGGFRPLDRREPALRSRSMSFA